MSSFIVFITVSNDLGSPGPFEIKRPLKFIFNISSDIVVGEIITTL